MLIYAVIKKIKFFFISESKMSFNLSSILDSAGGLLGFGGDPFQSEIGQQVEGGGCFCRFSDFYGTV